MPENHNLPITEKKPKALLLEKLTILTQNRKKELSQKIPPEQFTHFESLLCLRRHRHLDEGPDELIELRPEPRSVNQLGIRLGIPLEARSRGRREVGDQGSEEGLQGEERLEDVLRRRAGGDEGEEEGEVVDVGAGGEELVAEGLEVLELVLVSLLLPGLGGSC